MKNASVSIVVPAYNCEKTIADCLSACLAQTYFGSVEVIVIDDGSTDQTAIKIQSFPAVKYFYQANAGPATARNRGAAQAMGEFICFTDSDCLPQRDWVERLLAGFDESHVAVVAGSYGIVNKNNLLARCVHAEIIWRHKHLVPKFPKSFGSYNFCSRKEAFQKVGGFNSTYRSASGEDNDLSYKMLQSGYKILFEPKALVDHHHPENLNKYLYEQCRHGYWRAKLYLDHPSMSRGDGYTFWKDMVEVPLTILVVGGSVLSWWRMCWGLNGFIVFGVLFLMEFLFAFGMIRPFNLAAVFCWACVMMLRAFSRTAGFLAGGLYFLAAKFGPQK